jgi:hypothetical protein
MNSDLLGERPTKTMGDDNPMALRDHYLPTPYTSLTCLRLSDVTTAHYEIKPSTKQSLPSFLGLSIENPYNFLCKFLAIYSTIKLTGFTVDTLRMRLVLFSLKEIAKHWFHSLAPNSITSWAQLQQEFLKKYFPYEEPMTLGELSLVSLNMRANNCMRPIRDLRTCLDHARNMLSQNGSWCKVSMKA